MQVKVATRSCHEQNSGNCPHESKIKDLNSGTNPIQLYKPQLDQCAVRGHVNAGFFVYNLGMALVNDLLMGHIYVACWVDVRMTFYICNNDVANYWTFVTSGCTLIILSVYIYGFFQLRPLQIIANGQDSFRYPPMVASLHP